MLYFKVLLSHQELQAMRDVMAHEDACFVQSVTDKKWYWGALTDYAIKLFTDSLSADAILSLQHVGRQEVVRAYEQARAEQEHVEGNKLLLEATG